MASLELAASPQRGAWAGRDGAQIAGALALVALVAMLTVLPVAFVVSGSFEAVEFGRPGGYSLDAWRAVLTNRDAWQALQYSLLLALRAPVGAVVAFGLAWMLIRLPIPGRGWIEAALWFAFFIPTLPVTLGWILILDRDTGLLNVLLRPLFGRPVADIYSIPGILWVHATATTVPVMVILLGPAIRQFDTSLEESARSCGASAWKILATITLPLLAPAILTGAFAGFVRGLEAFEVEQLLGPPAGIYVYSTRIYDLISHDPPQFAQAMALSTLVLGMLIALTLVYQRRVMRSGFATLGSRGTSRRPMVLGNVRFLIAGLLLLMVGVTVVLPVIMLVLGSFMTLFGFFDLAHPFTGEHWAQIWRDPVFFLSLKNSAAICLATGVLGVVFYSGLAYLLLRTRMVGRTAIDLMLWLPWVVPGVLLGIALLWLMLTVPVLRPLYGTLGAIVAVLLIKDLPIGTHMIKSAIAQIPLDLELAAQVCGASRMATFRHIVVPLVKPMLASIFVLLCLSALRDISTTILLVNAATRPLSILMLEYASSSAREAGAAIGVIMTLIAGLVALVARRLGLQMTPN